MRSNGGKGACVGKLKREVAPVTRCMQPRLANSALEGGWNAAAGWAAGTTGAAISGLAAVKKFVVTQLSGNEEEEEDEEEDEDEEEEEEDEEEDEDEDV